MRTKLGKECRRLFRDLLARDFPEYIEDKGQIVPQGRYVWTRKHPSGVFLHIMLVIHPTRDEFTIEIGWSESGKLKSSTAPEGKKSLLAGPGHMRIPRLWTEYGEDPWWTLGLRPEEYEGGLSYYAPDPIESCLLLVAPAVQDAEDKLKHYAVPLFEEIVRRHGCSEKY